MSYAILGIIAIIALLAYLFWLIVMLAIVETLDRPHEVSTGKSPSTVDTMAEAAFAALPSYILVGVAGRISNGLKRIRGGTP